MTGSFARDIRNMANSGYGVVHFDPTFPASVAIAMHVDDAQIRLSLRNFQPHQGLRWNSAGGTFVVSSS
jgi:hypothetical protein